MSPGDYNGNITGIKWNVNHYDQKLKKAYGFTYDNMNRLLSAKYGEGSFYTNNGKYEITTSYDENGNIKTMYRKGNGIEIDNMTYFYKSSGISNQLQYVSDAADDNAGFTEKTSLTTEYTYDDNGNLTVDKNKGITDISYNVQLNLPQSITFSDGNINYTYTVDGQKLQFKDKNNKNTDYIGNFVYYDDTLRYVLTGEGMADYNIENNTFKYKYFLKDHLGNTRVVVDQTRNISQINDYYPFGMRHEPLAEADNSQKYLYNGKELQDETGWLDYGARYYDPALGRTSTQDPMMEKFYGLSPDSMFANNPIRFIDPPPAGARMRFAF